MKVLATLSGLTELDLSCNQITCNGVKCLADAVENSITSEKSLQVRTEFIVRSHRQ